MSSDILIELIEARWTMATWDPARYLRFSDQRSRPFVDLVGRVQCEDPKQVVDLGCGPGRLTATLADRWPGADVLGVDSSPEMITAAGAHRSDRVEFRLADLQSWEPDLRPDVIISNATLQWVPDHRRQLGRLLSMLAPDGWLAFQVPGNHEEPSHRLLHTLAADARFAEFADGLERPHAFDPEVYLADLSGPNVTVDAWETTYLHLLGGADPVFDWISGTGARPVLQSLPDELRVQFVAEYKHLLREAYPSGSYGTVLPFRRIFVVARLVS